ncbi:hypothetical protein AcidC75_31960 [Acidisoma sp. C75]
MARARTVISREMATAVDAGQTVAEAAEAAMTKVAEEVAAEAETLATEMAETTKSRMAAASHALAQPGVTFKEGMTKTMKTAEEVVAFGQGNVEALIKSGQIWSTGLQDLSKQMASSMQASYEEALAAFKAMTTVKSLKEAVDLQVGFTRSAIEKSMAESSKYTDASFKLAEQAIAPISSRMTMAVEKFTKSA